MGNVQFKPNAFAGSSGFSAEIPSPTIKFPPLSPNINRKNTPGFDYFNKQAYHVLHESYLSDVFKFRVRRQDRFSSEVGFNLHNREGFSKHSMNYPLYLGASCNLHLGTTINSTKEIVPSIVFKYSDVTVSLVPSFNTLNEQKSLQIESEYRNSTMNMGVNLNFNNLAPVIRAEGMLNVQGWLTGISMTYDSGMGELVSPSFTFGDENGIVGFTSLIEGERFKETVYLRVARNWHTAFSIAWSSQGDNSCLSVGCKYELPSGHGTLGAKLNNFGVLSLTNQLRIEGGITVNTSCSVQHAGLVECGFGIELEI